MKRWISLAVLALAAQAFSQGPGPGGPPPQGAPRGEMHRMGGGAMILGMPEVQKELNLTEDQKQKIRELMPRPRFDGPGGPPPEGGPPRGNPEAELNAKLKEILTEAQFARYRQLNLQFQGPMAAMRPDVGKELGITEDQRQKIREIMEQNRPTPPANGERPDPETMFKQMEAHREKVNAAVLALFSSEQKSKWQQMTGKPFNFNRHPGPPPPGG